jgi:hypothetical protein
MSTEYSFLCSHRPSSCHFHAFTAGERLAANKYKLCTSYQQLTTDGGA